MTGFDPSQDIGTPRLRIPAISTIARALRHGLQRTSAATALALWVTGSPLLAQVTTAPHLARLITLGSDTDDSLRLASLTDTTARRWTMIRSTSSLMASQPRDGRVHIRALSPEVRYTWNSDLPWSPNDGALWAGRGANRLIRAGFVLNAGPVRFIVAPEWITSENRAFQVIPYSAPGPRSLWANNFHPLPESIDLPFRFGDQAIRIADPGQSSLTIDLGATAVGVSTENLWWGPGSFNAILLSNNAAGVPHIFARTAHPWRTRFGEFEGQWIAGRLSESGFFDLDTMPRARSLSGLIVTWRPTQVSGFTMGMGRLVMSAAPNGVLSVGSAFDVLRSIGRPNTAPRDSLHRPSSDQIFSVFARMAVPNAGVEGYLEWARFEEPAGLTDLLEFPQHSQGYTIGLQWLRPFRSGSWRSQIELSYLEPSAALRLRPEFDSYTSAAVPQGFTNRGQVLGATIGPGSSSQMVATDAIFRRWRIGGQFIRLRNDNDALFSPYTPFWRLPDVTIAGTLRTSIDMFGFRIGADFTKAVRLNYLYQSYLLNPASGAKGGVDIPNRTITLSFTPVGRD